MRVKWNYNMWKRFELWKGYIKVTCVIQVFVSVMFMKALELAFVLGVAASQISLWD